MNARRLQQPLSRIPLSQFQELFTPFRRDYGDFPLHIAFFFTRMKNSAFLHVIPFTKGSSKHFHFMLSWLSGGSEPFFLTKVIPPILFYESASIRPLLFSARVPRRRRVDFSPVQCGLVSCGFLICFFFVAPHEKSIPTIFPRPLEERPPTLDFLPSLVVLELKVDDSLEFGEPLRTFFSTFRCRSRAADRA